MLFPTTLVGSYPQPEWLIDRAKLASRLPPRVRAKELWRVPEPHLDEAQRDATLIAIRAQEEAGLDIITDGEIRRESYSNRFATALDGVDIDNHGVAMDRTGHPNLPVRTRGRQRRLEGRGRSRHSWRSAGAADLANAFMMAAEMPAGMSGLSGSGAALGSWLRWATSMPVRWAGRRTACGPWPARRR